jgi:hypothetical protein
VSKYLYDPEFKKLVEKDLKGALKSVGVTITPQVQASLDVFQKSQNMGDFAKLAAVIDNNFVGFS